MTTHDQIWVDEAHLLWKKQGEVFTPHPGRVYTIGDWEDVSNDPSWMKKERDPEPADESWHKYDPTGDRIVNRAKVAKNRKANKAARKARRHGKR